jgi:hypothetical protein
LQQNLHQSFCNNTVHLIDPRSYLIESSAAGRPRQMISKYRSSSQSLTCFLNSRSSHSRVAA